MHVSSLLRLDVSYGQEIAKAGQLARIVQIANLFSESQFGVVRGL